MDVSVTELRQNLQEFLSRVRRGQRVRVTSRGRPIAEIIPPTAEVDAAAAARQRLRHSITRYDRPLEPAFAPEEWEMLK